MGKMQSVSMTEFGSGGFLDGVKGTIETAIWGTLDTYNDGETVCLIMDIQEDGGDLIEEKLWPAGSVEHFQPSEDGNDLLSDGRKIHKNAGSAYFMNSLASEGFDMKAIKGNIGGLVGAHLQFTEVVVGTYVDQSSGEEKERKVAIVSQLLESEKADKGKSAGKAAGKKAAPGGGKKKPPAGKAAGKKAPPAKKAKDAVVEDEGQDGDLDSVVAAAVREILAEKGGSLERKKLPQPMFLKLSELVEAEAISEGDRDDGVDMCWQEDWLAELDGVTYDADEAVLTLDED